MQATTNKPHANTRYRMAWTRKNIGPTSRNHTATHPFHAMERPFLEVDAWRSKIKSAYISTEAYSDVCRLVAVVNSRLGAALKVAPRYDLARLDRNSLPTRCSSGPAFSPTTPVRPQHVPMVQLFHGSASVLLFLADDAQVIQVARSTLPCEPV